MKCRFCDTDIEQDAQFCPNCGKDLSKFSKCVKCGELLDNGTVFCPHCGTEQPRKVVEEKTKSRKGVWIIASILLLCALAGGGYYFYDKNNGGVSLPVATDPTQAVVERVETDSTMAVEDEIVEKATNSKGFYVEVYYGIYFCIPKFLREGEQRSELAKDHEVFYENNGYSVNISVGEDEMETILWMYDSMRKRAGDGAYEESMKTIEKDYIKVDDDSYSILLIMKTKSGACGSMYFVYPEGGKAIVEEAVERSIQKTRENNV